MNILYLINFAGAAGTEKYVETLMAAAGREGHRCHLCYAIPGALSEKIRQAGYPVLQLDMRPRRLFAAAAQLADYCRENAVEVIHAQYPRENVIALLAARKCPGLRVVFTSHLTVHQGMLWNYVNRIFTPQNHCVISVCRQGVELLKENGVCPDKIRVIPNGIHAGPVPRRQNVIREEFGLSPETVVLFTAGRYAPEKGFFWLLEVLSRLRDKSDVPFVCLIAGTGEEYGAIAAEIRRRGLDKNVIQAGFRSDVPALLASADIYVSSSLREAMSFSILEAMAAALPLVVTDTGAGAELAEDCGFAVAPGDTEAMARDLLRLMTVPDLRLRLGRTARQKVCRDYDLDILIQQTLDSYA